MLRLLLIGLISWPAWAQNDALHTGAWFMYFGDHFWSEHWGLHAEAQLRRVNGVLKPQQLLIRPGLDFKLNDHLQFMVGYTNLQNYSYDLFSSPERITVHSIHEEATVSHPFGKVNFNHRFPPGTTLHRRCRQASVW